uniref:Uncharacterized protein n=1 Tax=Oryza brachyantha TaxID=4533 RepID=J3MD42_ORYBR
MTARWQFCILSLAALYKDGKWQSAKLPYAPSTDTRSMDIPRFQSTKKGLRNEPKALKPVACKACDAEPPEGSVDFGFCYGNLALNGFCPIGNVKDQDGSTCLANALASAVEITQRISRIIRGEPLSEEGPVVDVNDLLMKYKILCEERGLKYDNFDVRSLINMLRVLEVDGVRAKGDDNLYKIHDWDYIDKDDFATLTSALADGYPLIAGFQTGKSVCFLQPGEIYMPPKQGS